MQSITSFSSTSIAAGLQTQACYTPLFTFNDQTTTLSTQTCPDTMHHNIDVEKFTSKRKRDDEDDSQHENERTQIKRLKTDNEIQLYMGNTASAGLGLGLQLDAPEQPIIHRHPVWKTESVLIGPAEFTGSPTLALPPFNELLGNEFHHYPFVRASAGAGLGITWEMPALNDTLSSLSS